MRRVSRSPSQHPARQAFSLLDKERALTSHLPSSKVPSLLNLLVENSALQPQGGLYAAGLPCTHTKEGLVNVPYPFSYNPQGL